MKKLNKILVIFVLFVLFFILKSNAQNDTCRTKPAVCIHADIVFIADWSSSVFNKKNYIVNAARTLSENFVLSNDGIKMGIVTFSDKGNVIVKCSGDQTEFRKATNYLALDEPYGNTDMALGLEKAETLFSISKEERNNEPEHKFIILISDGETGNIDESFQIATRLKKDHVFIYTIQVIEEGDDETAFDGSYILKNIASDQGFYYRSTYESLYEIIKKLEFCN